MEEVEKHTLLLLFRQLSQGDEKALDAIHDGFRNHIVRYLQRFDGMDAYLSASVVSELLEKMWEKHKRFAVEESPMSLMFAMVHKIALYRLREQRKKTVPLQEAMFKSSSYGADDVLLFKEYEKKLLAAIALLPPQERKVCMCHYANGLSSDEIASLLHVSKQTVKNELSRALKKIKQRMGLTVCITLIELLKYL